MARQGTEHGYPPFLLNYHPCPNSLSPARCVGTVIYFAYPLKHLPDLYSTSIQLQTAGNAPEVDHVQDGRISSATDSQRGAPTPAKLLPLPKNRPLWRRLTALSVWFPLRWRRCRARALRRKEKIVTIPASFKKLQLFSLAGLKRFFIF